MTTLDTPTAPPKPLTLMFNLEEQRFEGSTTGLLELMDIYPERLAHDDCYLLALPWIACWLHPDDVYAMLTAQAVSEHHEASCIVRMGPYLQRVPVRLTFTRVEGRAMASVERVATFAREEVKA